jgi:hypothetical protein
MHLRIVPETFKHDEPFFLRGSLRRPVLRECAGGKKKNAYGWLDHVFWG